MRRESGAAGYRHARLEGILFEELNTLLRDDVTDPSLSGVRVMSIKLSVDYRSVRVHVAVDTSKPDLAELRREVLGGLARATPFLRYQLSNDLELKRTPELHFVFDGAIPQEEPKLVNAEQGTGNAE